MLKFFWDLNTQKSCFVCLRLHYYLLDQRQIRPSPFVQKQNFSQTLNEDFSYVLLGVWENKKLEVTKREAISHKISSLLGYEIDHFLLYRDN